MKNRINLNKLAQDVSRTERGKKSVDIAQIKEVIACTLDALAVEKPSKVLALLESR